MIARALRIAMISTPFLPVPPKDYGGTELVVSELVEGLVERGHDVTLFATGDSRTSASLRWMYREPQWPPDVLTDINHVTWALKEVLDDSFDLAHAHSAVALTAVRLSDIPLVYTVHHVRDEALSMFYRNFPEPYYVAISADQKAREIPLPRMTVIHHGLDFAAPDGPRRPGDYLCFVGRLARIKGPHTAIDIAAAAGLPICIAGEVHRVDSDRHWADRELNHRLQQPHVRVLGPVGGNAKGVLLRDARALLAPIEWNEPFGLILIEAMHAGCPVVTYPRGSASELIDHGVTGFLAESADDMVDLVRPGGAVDSFDRDECRHVAAERFGRARMVLEYERLYRRVVTEVSRAHAAQVPAGIPLEEKSA